MLRRLWAWFSPPDARISRRQAKRLAQQIGIDKEQARAMVKFYESERDRDRPA